MPETKALRKSAVVLLSAGLDSTFNLFKARENFEIKLALTFNYGQRAASREMGRAADLCRQLGIRHQVIELPWFKDFTRTSLVTGRDIPVGAAVGIDDRTKSMSTAKSVWVPNRNGILLNIAAGFAEGLEADFVIPGFNIEEASTFPDNSQDFLDSLDNAWKFSTNARVKTMCLSTGLNKTQIVAEGIQLKLPFAKLWPCYLDGAEWCGGCESCQRYKRALEANGLSFEELRRTK